MTKFGRGGSRPPFRFSGGGQSKKFSLLEACVNVTIGIGVAWGLSFLVFPIFGYEPTVMKTLWISLIFTAVSLIRSYLLRRLFNLICMRYGK